MIGNLIGQLIGQGWLRIMHSTKPPAETPSPTCKRSARPAFFFLFTAVAALAVYGFLPFLTEYTLCSTSGHIYTVNEAQPQAQCISIRNDRILRVGTHGTSSILSKGAFWLDITHRRCCLGHHQCTFLGLEF